jgi:hypothetical protein
MPQDNFPNSQKEDFYFSNIPNLRNVPDQELVSLCLQNNRPAWEEFFFRFIPEIKKGIEKILYSFTSDDLSAKEEMLWNIHEKIVVKLYQKGALRGCKNPARVRFWLHEIAKNQTIDWLRKQGGKKGLPESQFLNSLVALSAPLKGNPDHTLEDTIPNIMRVSAEEADKGVNDYLKRVLDTMYEIDNQKKFWTFRLCIMSVEPFSHEEVEELAALNGYPIEDLKNHLEKMIDDVQTKEEKCQEYLGKADILWYEIRRLEGQVREKIKECENENHPDISKLRKKIQKKESSMELLREKGQKFCRPSNESIGKMIGLVEDKVKQVSLVFERAREELKKKNEK